MDNFKKEYQKIEKDYYTENPFKALLEQKRVFNKKPLILYGCGILCRTIISVCNDFNIKITAICDTYKTGTYIGTELEIITPEQLKNKYPESNIIICSYKYADEIYEKLISLGYPESQIFRSTLSMVSFIHPSDFIRKYYDGYEWAYNFFVDDISKKIIIDRIRMYFTGVELFRTSSAPEYFEPGIINLGENEVFVDAGAYVGDTAEEFIKQAKYQNSGEYRHIYSFEPDDVARNKAVQNLDKYSNIDIIGKGLWSCECELNFYSDGGNASSTFVVGGLRTLSVPVTSIDTFFTGKPDDELPTFIKMDIEGAEKEAIIGSKNIIRLKHPKLAICVYHKPEDIYELTKLIYEIEPSYQFSLQQCTDGIYETVLYAV
ncbi:FkbM family methyltransferase [Ruminiclostridium cellobioparum]|uniref:FkbM family methyltransferase n=1 Tax=Ruminiclostridium cellobioparum TaxID=29355 RepID=UPI0028B0B3BE|nr:FkbM family methyltransferase [Ruminiclostridium cellobioparum]